MGFKKSFLCTSCNYRSLSLITLYNVLYFIFNPSSCDNIFRWDEEVFTIHIIFVFKHIEALKLMWISFNMGYQMSSERWYEISYPFRNFTCCIFEVWKWMSDFITDLGNVVMQNSMKSELDCNIFSLMNIHWRFQNVISKIVVILIRPLMI